MSTAIVYIPNVKGIRHKYYLGKWYGNSSRVYIQFPLEKL